MWLMVVTGIYAGAFLPGVSLQVNLKAQMSTEQRCEALRKTLTAFLSTVQVSKCRKA